MKIKLSSKFSIPNAEIKYFSTKISFFFSTKHFHFQFEYNSLLFQWAKTHEMEVEAAIASAALLGMTMIRRLSAFDRNC